MRLSLRIDDTNHALLAMIALTTIEPDGFGVVDPDCVDRSHSIRWFDRHEP